MQLTDKDNGCCEFPATLRDDVPLYVEAPCNQTPDPAVGSTCAVTTTADAVIPGMVREGRRAIWQMSEPVKVYDAGPDASGATPRSSRPRESSFLAQLMKSAASQGLPGAITSWKRSSSSGSIE